ncbi:MAG TPA: SIS domain-containing protein [Aliidongia sp.]|nr:SIS domain-containing protein [Aliidongia sp.]
MPLETALRRAMEMARTTHRRGNKLMFIGNGGSAAIASHMAIDYSKNGGMRSLAFNDPAALTCLGNDHGYEHVFAKQLEFHAVAGDFLIAISSSGRSENIIRGVEMARSLSCQILTLTSFNGDNPLRRLGDLNIYVATSAYGFAEISHLTLCHAILDRAVELSANRTLAQQQELV